MAEAFLGEVRIFPYGGPVPYGWAPCNGQLLQKSQNMPLYSLIGTTYGGDGEVEFALPDLRGRCVESFGPREIGTASGEARHALTISEMPPHTHQALASDVAATQVAPADKFWARESRGFKTFATASNGAANAGAISSVGASQSHQNMMPFLALQFCIVIEGNYPFFA